MLDKPLISVLVPLYNHANYIADCLSSIRDCGYQNTEVIIVDDGSRDASVEAVREWRAQNPEAFHSFIFHTQPNQGITRTLNRMVALATGEFIALLASDDRLLPDGLDVRYEALKKNPNWLAVFGDCHVIDSKGELVSPSGVTAFHATSARSAALLDPQLIQLELILRWSIPGPVLLLRKTAFSNVTGVGLYDESLVVEDRDYYLRLLAINALGYIHVPVAQYRVHGNNAIRQSGWMRILQLRSLQVAAAKSASGMTGISQFALKTEAEMLKNIIENKRGLKRAVTKLTWSFLRKFQMLRLWVHSLLAGVSQQ